MKVIILSILHSFNTLAFTQTFNNCPDKFIATVTSVYDLDLEGLSKIEVSFNVIQNLKGNAFETKSIQIIKDGPFSFKVGHSYTVETRDKWLCRAEVLSSN